MTDKIINLGDEKLESRDDVKAHNTRIQQDIKKRENYTSNFHSKPNQKENPK
jgi:hypothetical protein